MAPQQSGPLERILITDYCVRVVSFIVSILICSLFIYLFASARLELSESAPRTFSCRNGKQIMRRQTFILVIPATPKGTSVQPAWQPSAIFPHTHNQSEILSYRKVDSMSILLYSSWIHFEPFFPLERVACETLELSSCCLYLPRLGVRGVLILPNCRQFNCN